MAAATRGHPDRRARRQFVLHARGALQQPGLEKGQRQQRRETTPHAEPPAQRGRNPCRRRGRQSPARRSAPPRGVRYCGLLQPPLHQHCESFFPLLYPLFPLYLILFSERDF